MAFKFHRREGKYAAKKQQTQELTNYFDCQVAESEQEACANAQAYMVIVNGLQLSREPSYVELLQQAATDDKVTLKRH